MNYYEELEVTTNASTAVIKAAYKAQVKHYHPDVFKGDKLFATNKLIKLNKAYEVLCNPSKRSEYDNLFGFNTQQKAYSSNNYQNENDKNFSNGVPKDYDERMSHFANKYKQNANPKSHNVEKENINNLEFLDSTFLVGIIILIIIISSIFFISLAASSF